MYIVYLVSEQYVDIIHIAMIYIGSIYGIQISESY